MLLRSIFASIFSSQITRLMISSTQRNAAAGPWIRGAVFVTTIFFILSTLAVILGLLFHPTSSIPRTTFFILGDYGRHGFYNQSLVADLMDRKAQHLKPQFIISTGDNFYQSGLVSVYDTAFDESFSKVYHHQSLQIPWHAVLGNHDYGDIADDLPLTPSQDYCDTFNNKSLSASKDDSTPAATQDCYYSPLHQLDARLQTERDWRWHLERLYSETFANDKIEIFFIDTNSFIEEYKARRWASFPGGILQQDYASQVKELETKLAASKAVWKFIVGHHPPRSNGDHGNNVNVIKFIEPLMQRYNVQAYFSGHDHNLEHVHVKETGINIFVCGAGSDTSGRGFIGTDDSEFQYQYSGFAAATVYNDEFMSVSFYAVSNEKEQEMMPIYSVRLERGGS